MKHLQTLVFVQKVLSNGKMTLHYGFWGQEEEGNASDTEADAISDFCRRHKGPLEVYRPNVQTRYSKGDG